MGYSLKNIHTKKEFLMDPVTRKLVETVNNIVAPKDSEIRALLGFQGPAAAWEGETIEDFKKFLHRNSSAFYKGPNEPIDIQAAAKAFKYRNTVRSAAEPVAPFSGNTINTHVPSIMQVTENSSFNEGFLRTAGQVVGGLGRVGAAAKSAAGLGLAGALAGAGLGAAEGYNTPKEPESGWSSWIPGSSIVNTTGNMVDYAVTRGLQLGGIGAGLGVAAHTPGKRQALKTAQNVAGVAADAVADAIAKGVDVGLPPTARTAGKLAGQAATSSAGKAVGKFVADEASTAGRAARILKTAGKAAKVLGPIGLAAGIADTATATDPEQQKLTGAAMLNPFVAAGQLLGMETPAQKRQTEAQKLKNVLEKGVWGQPTQTPEK